MKLYAVGIGPGELNYLAPKAKDVLLSCDVIVGYTAYVKLVAALCDGKEVLSTGMKSELERCQAAIDLARQGKRVAVVSSGDPGIYGMASLLYELAAGVPEVDVEVIPGVTAANAAAAILGAPLSNDFAVISLSDLLTSWDVIEKRLEAVSAADMALCLYNPQSHSRKDYLQRACDIMLRHKPASTLCGTVRNALRGESAAHICTLGELGRAEVDMLTAVIIGNSATKVINGRLVTLRGYRV